MTDFGNSQLALRIGSVRQRVSVYPLIGIQVIRLNACQTLKNG